MLTILLAICAFLPSLVYMTMSTSSMLIGFVLASCVCIFLIAVRGRAAVPRFDRIIVQRSSVIGLVSAATLLCAHQWVTLISGKIVDAIRLLGSDAAIALGVAGALAVSTIIHFSNSCEWSKALHRVYFTLLLIAFASLIGLPPLGGGSYEKPVVVFTERSHFALAFAPFALASSVIARGWKRELIVWTNLVIILALQSLTGLCAVILCFAATARSRTILLGIVAATMVLPLVDLEYYGARLLLNDDTNRNLSALVFLQGWERAFDAIFSTGGLGYGFQQFGYESDLGGRMAAIFTIAGEELNQFDGGTTAAKLIGELGIIGGILILWYLGVAVNAFRELRRAARNSFTENAYAVFCDAALVCYGLELFVRGVGYFSPGLLFLFLAIIRSCISPLYWDGKVAGTPRSA